MTIVRLHSEGIEPGDIVRHCRDEAGRWEYDRVLAVYTVHAGIGTRRPPDVLPVYTVERVHLRDLPEPIILEDEPGKRRPLRRRRSPGSGAAARPRPDSGQVP